MPTARVAVVVDHGIVEGLCSNEGCAAAQGDPKTMTHNCYICPYCHKQFCGQCFIAIHEGSEGDGHHLRCPHCKALLRFGPLPSPGPTQG